MLKIKRVVNRFADLVHRQFGLSIEFTDLLNQTKPLKNKVLNAVQNHKQAKLIVIDNDLIIPITKNDFLYGYISIFEGVTLQPDQVEKVQILTDLLIRSVVVTQHKKQIINNIEGFLKHQYKKDSNNTSPQSNEYTVLSHIKLLNPKQPVLILAHTKKAAEKQAHQVHLQSQAITFLSIHQIHEDRLQYPELISYLGDTTIYIPEITLLSSAIQTSLLHYLETQSHSSHLNLYQPRIVAATTKTFAGLKQLIDKQKINKALLCHLSKSKITGPPSEYRREDIQDLSYYLFYKEEPIKNVILFKPKNLNH